jgi:hypothetical protein
VTKSLSHPSDLTKTFRCPTPELFVNVSIQDILLIAPPPMVNSRTRRNLSLTDDTIAAINLAFKKHDVYRSTVQVQL